MDVTEEGDPTGAPSGLICHVVGPSAPPEIPGGTHALRGRRGLPLPQPLRPARPGAPAAFLPRLPGPGPWPAPHRAQHMPFPGGVPAWGATGSPGPGGGGLSLCVGDALGPWARWPLHLDSVRPKPCAHRRRELLVAGSRGRSAPAPRASLRNPSPR